MALRKASRMVMLTISVPSGMSGSAAAWAAGASGAFETGASCFLLSVFSPFGAAAADFCGAALLALMSELFSPLLRITAIGVFTATSAVPSGTRIFPMVPSSVASTSIVALSVSISAMISPDLTASPSFLSHLARLPFSMVGDNAGMSTSIGIFVFLSVDVGVKLGHVRLRIVGGEFGSLVDQITHGGIDLL